MTVTNETSSVTHNGNGVTTTWPYTFRIPNEDAANVGVFDTETNVLTTLAPALYEITGLNDDDGGSVEYPLPFTTDPISATERLVIWREVTFTQDLELTNQSPYFPTVLEDQLDLIVYQVQQLAEEVDRAIKVTLGSGLTPDEFVEDLQAGAAEAQASATAAAASATAADSSADAAAISETNAATSETAAEAAATTAAVDAVTAVGLPGNPTALHYLRRNAGDTAYEELDAGEVADDINAVRYDAASVLTDAEQGQARANIGGDLLGGFRNKLINGDFDIWQRGVSLAETVSTPLIFADRWRVHVTAGLTAATARVAANAGNPYKYYAQVTLTGTGAAGSNIRQRIEGVGTLAGKTVTLSAYVATSVEQNVSVLLQQYFGTGGSPSATVGTTVGTIEAKTSFTSTGYVKLTVDLPSITGKTLGTDGNDYLELLLLLTQPNGVVISLGHVSLVEGDATAETDPFSPRHIQQELALCQRYYEKSFDLDTTPAQSAGFVGAVSFVGQATNNPMEVSIQFKERKRTTPTITTYSPAAANDNWYAADQPVAAVFNTGDTGFVIRGSSPVTVGRSYSIQWTADAEL